MGFGKCNPYITINAVPKDTCVHCEDDKLQRNKLSNTLVKSSHHKMQTCHVLSRGLLSLAGLISIEIPTVGFLNSPVLFSSNI